MRDLLHDKYKSSSKSKVARRRSQRSQKRQECPSRSLSASSGDYSSAPSITIPQDKKPFPSMSSSTILEGDVQSTIRFQTLNNHHLQSSNQFESNSSNDTTVLAPKNPIASDDSIMMQDTVAPLMSLSRPERPNEGNVSVVVDNASTPVVGKTES